MMLAYHVSILARPEGRALPTWLNAKGWEDDVSILARPEGRALRYTSIARIRSSPFQSSPVPKDGRYRFQRLFLQDRPCFNPRPSRRTGATS